jgi:outer membrane protein insertion porin family
MKTIALWRGRPEVRPFVLFIAATLMLAAGPAWAEVVSKIVITGNRALEVETIKSLLESKEGQEFTPGKVSKDVRALYASGFIQDVVVEKSDSESGTGYVLTYFIKEKPIVNDIRFEGNKKLSKDELKKINDIKPRSAFNPSKVREVRGKILDEYSKQGYFMAEVEVEIAEVAPNLVDIIFHMQEGKKPTVKEIKFFGNEKMSDRKLRGRMSTKQEGMFSGKKYSKEDFRRDQLILDFYYDDNGYIEATFDPTQRMLTEDREHVVLGLGIVEGQQYRVGVIKVEGDLLVPEEKLKKEFLLRSGEVFRKSLFLRDQQFLLNHYGDQGYALCEIDPEVKLHKDTRLVDLTWHIRKGTKVYIERIDVKGNDKTYDKVVRRELDIKEGQLFSTSGMRESEKHVKRLGYFSDVQVVPKPGSEPNRIKLDVALKEQSSGAFIFGAGVTTAEEYFFSLQYQQRNFLGLGLDMSAQAMISTKTQNYYLRWADPYFLDTSWYLGLEAYSAEEYYVSFIDKRTGGTATLGRKLPHLENTRFYLTYSYQSVDLKGFKQNTIYAKQPASTDIGRLGLTFDHNTLNNMMDPTEGARQRLRVEFAGYGVFGGSHDFIKTELDTWNFEPIFQGTYLGIHTRWRVMSYDRSDALLISERYFQGGAKSMRGYEIASISPMFREDNGKYTPIGGNKDVLISLDYIIPISPEMGMKLDLFYDLGQVYNDYEPMDLRDLRADWGFGLKWNSPMGPLTIGIGFPIKSRTDDKSQQFVFSVGTIF